MSNVNEKNSEIDDIVAELKESSTPSSTKNKEIIIPKITDDNVGEYIYEKTAEVIENAISAMSSMSTLIQTAADPEEIGAYTKLMQTAIKGIENLNKINIQQKQAQNNIEMKRIEADGRKNQPVLGGGNQIFIGTREEALKLPPRKIELLKDEDVIDS
jgi:hypothetical protein